METAKLKAAFLSFKENGFNPFPVICYEVVQPDKKKRREKLPVVSWKDYQNRAPSAEEIEKWCAHPRAIYYGIGIATTGLCVVDIDQKDGKPDMLEYLEGQEIESMMWTATAGGGVHLFYLDTFGAKNATNIFRKDKDKGDTVVDIRGSGGYVVVGPTELWNTNPFEAVDKGALKVVARYKTRMLTRPEMLPAPPKGIIEAVKLVADGTGQTVHIPKYKSLTFDAKVGEGERNDTATSLAFRLLVGVRKMSEFKEAEAIYWEVIKRKFADWEPNAKEYARCWGSGVSKMKAQKGKLWPEQANDIIDEVKGKVKDEMQLARDLNEWGLNIKEVLRIGEIFKIKLADGSAFEIDAVDIYSQAKFRAAYTFGTNKMIPAIKPRSFEKLIMSLTPTDLVDSGTSLKSILEQLLQTQMQRCGQADTDDQAREMVTASAWALFGNRIYFKQESLAQAHPSLGKIGTGKIVSALQDIGAKQDKMDGIKFWYYEK